VQRFDLVIPRSARRVCRVRVGRGALDRFVEETIADPPGRLLVLVSDDTVAPLHAEPLRRRLVERGLAVELLTFPAGEPRKTRETKSALEDGLVRVGAGRDSAIVAVGGGVTGDLAGFVAATWHRGIPVVQLPTSLLAMVDAALGGKTAVNLRQGKNLVGAFHQPLALYADVETLETLPDEELGEGLAELVKAAVIADAGLFRWLETDVETLLARRTDALEHAVGRALRIKQRVVSRDERESGRRAVLNFGHTVAHALESVADYQLRHGRAVAVGMCVEARLAVRVTGFPRRNVERIERLLGRCGLATEVPAGISVEALLGATARDKKARSGRVRYALPRAMGRMPVGDEVTVEVPEEAVRDALGLD
jgi:3-dehydroquinate synthase